MTVLYLFIGAFIIGFIYHFVKALKDPDVQKASDLRMSITRYRKYQRLYDEYQDFMMEHGVESKASQDKFKEIWKQIDNPNEWRRYSAYREEEYRKEFYKKLNEL